MKKVLLSILLIFFMLGCESKEEKDRALKAEQFKQEQLAKAAEEKEQQAKSEKEAADKKLEEQRQAEERERLEKQKTAEPSMMNKMGVSMEDGKLIIDTNKTKKFFTVFQEKMDNTSREIDRELREGNLTVTVPAGIEVTSKKVSIDLNKSESFFKSWGEKMESFAKEFDKMTRSLYDANQTK